MNFPPIQSTLCSSLKLLCCRDGHFRREQSILWEGTRRSKVATCSWPETFPCRRLLGQMVQPQCWASSAAHRAQCLEWSANDLIRSLVCHWLMDPTFCWPESYENSPLPVVVCPKINHPLHSKCVFYFSVSGFAFQTQTMPFSAAWKGLFTWGVSIGWRFFFF